MDHITAKTMGVFAIRMPSAGRFFNALQVDYTFGVPLSASASGLAMDIGLIRSLVRTPDGTKDKQLQFMQTSGMNSSALEHSVPEQLFSMPNNPAQGISAVKALQIANEQGIPIYTINQSNINSILPQLQVDNEVKIDIQNAVNAGKEVTVPKTNITFNGGIGCGYFVIYPNTGAGAYMISGGMNGGMLLLCALLPGCFSLVAILFAALLTNVIFLLYLIASIVILFIAIIAQVLMVLGPYIFTYLALVNLCGEAATKEYLKCLAEILGEELIVTGVTKLIEKIPFYLIKILGKSIHIAALYYAIYRFYECNMRLSFTCESN
mgnify:FL=1